MFTGSGFSNRLFLLTLASSICIPAALYYLLISMPLSSRHRQHSLPQIISQRILADQVLLGEDKSDWYRIEPELLSSDSFKEKFVQLNADEETRSFIEQSVEKSDWLFTQLWHNLAKTVLSFFYSKTDINGILERGSMFVLSKGQVKLLTDEHFSLDESSQKEALIDLGAGDGCPTQSFAHFFKNVFATEASGAMRKLLGRKGIEVLEIDAWDKMRTYDMITCLNLLDRCDEPLSILRQIHAAVRTDGVVVLAVVLPFRPYVEFSQQPNSTSNNMPVQELKVEGKSFEKQAESFAYLLEAEGFRVLSWSRVPYICEGDLAKSVYTLDDVVFVLRKDVE